ncbi:MAG: Ig-like domain-containing protein, partial [Saprospiraceae bacterium]|nr:Ig-like domain-containing protein [Saprospiraceae bacterium]
DVDGDLDPTTAITTTGPASGSVVNNGNGSFDYTPDPGFSGNDSFDYQVCDTSGLCDSATVTITVNPAVPNTLEVRVSASEDDAEERASGRVTFTSSDLELIFDREDQTVGLRFNGITIPQGSSITKAYVQFQVDETKSVDPTLLNIQGQAADNALTFDNVDGNISSRPTTAASVSWTPPTWNTVGEAGADQQTPDIKSVIQEIVDRPGWTSGNSLAIIITGTGQRAAESYNGDQAGAPLLHVEYFEVNNDPPVAIDDTANTPEDTAVIIDVAANDSDPDGNLDPTTANINCPTCAGTANGPLVNNGDGSFDYTPNPDFNGSDSFIYEICDAQGECSTATVSITVDPINDPPIAVNDSATTSEDTLVTINVVDNDLDVDGDLDPTTVVTTTLPANGSVTNKGDGSLDYTPNPAFNGDDSFGYRVCDATGLCDTATVNITVNIANDPPVAMDDTPSTPEDTAVIIDVAANDSDPDGNLDPTTANSSCANGSAGCLGATSGSLTDIGDGTITYTPNPDFNGSDSFVYEICDTLTLCDIATVTVTVSAVDDPPVANDDSVTTTENIAVTIDATANDTDVDG